MWRTLMVRYKKSKKGSVRFILYAIAAVLAVMLFIELRSYYNIQGMVAQFFEECIKGNTEYAREKIRDMSGDDRVFIETLQQGDTIQWVEVGYVDLLPTKTKKVDISLGINDNKYKTSLWVTKSNGSWLIKDLPKLKKLEQAYVINQHGKKTATDFELLIGEKRQNLSYPAAIQEDYSGSICRLLILDDQVINISPLIKKTGTKVLTVKDNLIEDAGFDLLNLSPSVCIYQYKDDEIKAATLEDIIPGMSDISYYMTQDMVSAMVIGDDFPLDTIRVALNTTGFKGLKHQRVEINCTEDIVVENKISNKSYTIPPNTMVTFQRMDDAILWSYGDENFLSKAYRLYIYSPEGEPISVPSIERGSDGFVPAYHGNLEVSMYEDGLAIINELPLEQYLYTVVPSEMPLSFGIEPLKAQAVAARTYAVSSIMKSGFRFAAAHVDDSVASQVYNNTPAYPSTNQAVDNTQGEVLFFDDQPINAAFFSTSCGFTANNNEVWEDKTTKEFPGTPVPYLQSRSQTPKVMMYLDNEQEVRDFLTSDIPEAYDAVSPYFRWTVRLNQSQLQAMFNSNLPSLEKSQPNYIFGMDQQSQSVFSDLPFDIGTISDIWIAKRGQGGNAMELEIQSSAGSFKIIKELNIRLLFKPTDNANLDVNLHNGRVQKNYGLLPSAFVYLDILHNERGEIEYLTIYGGGNGHGCGMSQYGAYGLAQRGYNYIKILNHYYPGIEIKNIFN
jgi:stage II sporulation protein D